MKRERNSNVEFLRILAMLLIIASHYGHGFETIDLGYGVNRLFLTVFTSFGQVGVGIYLLIAGYYMVEKDSKLNIRKLLNIYVDVFFYSITILVLFLVFNKESIYGIQSILMSIAPVLYVNYWYVSTYIIIMLLSPFFNKYIYALSQNEYKVFLTVMFLMFSGTRLLYGSFNDAASGFAFGKLIPCFNIYFMAGYLKRFYTRKENGGGVLLSSNSCNNFVCRYYCNSCCRWLSFEKRNLTF